MTGRRADGYHLLDSLVAFADIGDRLTAKPAATLSLELCGPEAGSLAAVGDDNLVLRAARLLADHTGITAGASCPNNLIEETLIRLFELRGITRRDLELAA